MAIGSATAGGITTIVTTNGTHDLVDGLHVITARQTGPGKLESGSSEVLMITVDTIPPAPGSWSSAMVQDGTELLLRIPDDGSFSEPRKGGVRTLVIDFSEDVDLSGATAVFSGNDGSLDGPDLWGITASVSRRDGDTGQILFSDPLPDDVTYLVRLDGVTDVAGNQLAGDNARTMTALCGDVNGDLETNVFDLLYAWDYRARAADAGVEETRCDVNCDGMVSVFDLLLAWDHRGHDATGYAAPALPAAASQAAGSLSQTYATSVDEHIAGGILAASSSVQGLAAFVVAAPISANVQAGSPLAASTTKAQASATTPDTPSETVGIVPAILTELSSQAQLAPLATPALAGRWLWPPSSDPSAPTAELEPSLDTNLANILGEQLDRMSAVD